MASNASNKPRVRGGRSEAKQSGSLNKEPTPPPTVNGEADSDGENIRVDYRLSDLEVKTTLGTGTFGRVVLVRHKPTRDYLALKVLNISEVIRLKQEQHVKNEKEILSTVNHPFIVNMLWTHHNDTFLYMLLEFICGGELFSYLRNAGRFNNATSNFYACEIISALDYLHSRCIVYRDLKPENLLLDKDGHLKLTDFGFAKNLVDRTWTLCGTPEYLAPEIILSKGHNKAVDWWALGILIYEMLVGYPPYFDENPFGIYEKILAAKIEWPRHVNLVSKYPPFFDENPMGIYQKILAGIVVIPKQLDKDAKDLIKKLLVADRTKRLGNMKNAAADVKGHKWFRHVNWDDVLQRKLEPPIVPRLRHSGDTRNFFDYPELESWEAWVKQASAQHPPNVPKTSHPGDTQYFEEYPEDDWQNAGPALHSDASLFDDF